MNLIATVDENWGIGRNGSLLVSIPKDQTTFQQMTAGKVIVMGRRTLERMQNGLALPNRTNVILTSNLSYRVKGAVVLHSVNETLSYLEQYEDDEVFFIGGESIYRQFFPYCKVAHITKIHFKYDSDAYFPNLDKDPDWQIVADSDEQTYFDLTYHFLKYERR